ncbi:hypothetical protein DSECCO2_330550 [anaerobic digester metagenome]
MNPVVAGGYGVGPCRQRDVYRVKRVVNTVQDKAAAIHRKHSTGLQAFSTGILCQYRLTATAGGNGKRSVVNREGRGTLNPVAGGGDRNGAAVDRDGSIRLRVIHVRIGLQPVISRGEDQNAAVHCHGTVAGQGIIRRVDGQRQIRDRDGCARTALDSVFAGSLHV